MKKLLALTAALLLGLSTMAFAGPLIGIQVAPAINSAAALTVGWDFGYSAIEGSKEDFESWYGKWTIAALWTPSDDTFSYRFGPKLLWKWDETSGALKYKGLALVLGVARTWGAFQLFGEFDIGSTGALNLKPLIGINVLFEGFFSKTTSESLDLGG